MRCGVTIYPKAYPEERYYMAWRFFMKLNADGHSYFFEEDTHSIAVPVNSFISKMIWATWRHENERKFLIKEGEYVMVFHYWTKATGAPNNKRHAFYITRNIFDSFEQYRATKTETIIDVTLDKPVSGDLLFLEDNMILNAKDASSLLGV